MPVILIDPYKISNLTRAGAAWLYTHECGHHYLGHFERGYLHAHYSQKQAMELEADCYAVQGLTQLGLLTQYDVGEIAALASQQRQMDLAHPDGIVRASQISQCWKKGPDPFSGE